MRRTSGTNASVFLCLTLLVGRAFADDNVAAARRHFEAGTRAYNLGEFSAAAEAYRQAYKLKPDSGTVDPVNAVVWMSSSSGVAGYANATKVNGIPSATYKMSVTSPGAIALDLPNHKFYMFYTGTGANNGSIERFAYNAPTDLNTSNPTSEAYFYQPSGSVGMGAIPLELFVNPANGDLWGAFTTARSCVVTSAYNSVSNATPTKCFTISSATYAYGVAYAPAAGGTLYTGWDVTSAFLTNGTYAVTGIDAQDGGTVSASSATITSSRGPLAIGNSMLMVPGSSGGVQAWSLTTPSNTPIKTVMVPGLALYGLVYVP